MLDKAKRYFRKVQIRNRQRIVDRRFAEEGLTDEILDLQIEINKLRHEFDISDSSNSVFDDFVQ